MKDTGWWIYQLEKVDIGQTNISDCKRQRPKYYLHGTNRLNKLRLDYIDQIIQ